MISSNDRSTFFYFGYGSNLNEKRIKINNPNSERRGFGELKNYRLEFIGFSYTWNGSPATIVAENGKSVWGAIWEIDLSHLADLDRQEGVHLGIYHHLTLPIITAENEIIECRVYIKNEILTTPSTAPTTNKPSITYLNVILDGAKETGLPESYIEYLANIEHNGQEGPAEILEALKS